MRWLIFIVIAWVGQVTPHCVQAQHEGDTWLTGYSSSDDLSNGVFKLDFSTGNLELLRMEGERSHFRETSAVVCDQMGEPLLWSNGMEIRGRGNAMVEDTISFVPDNYDVWPYKPSYWLWYRDDFRNLNHGFVMANGSLIIQVPGEPNIYYVIYHLCEDMDIGGWRVVEWRLAQVQYSESTGYQVLFKDAVIGGRVDWYVNTINAVRHANGRDWWLFALQDKSNKYYSFLVDPTGIRLYAIDTLPVESNSLASTAVISPSGAYMAMNSVVQGELRSYATLFNIDRCAGRLTHLMTMDLEYSPFGGVAFSPSEQYFYLDEYAEKLWQYDLWAEDIESSRTLVGVYDGFGSPGPFPTSFGPMMQTPDGRIYVVPASGSNEYLHVIDRPDLPGEASKFLQHHIHLTVPQGRTLPNVPNFRLGPIDGSSCDTLGIDNLAASRWRWEPDDPADPLTVRFTDLSYYAPDTWSWDFDGAGTSDQPSPVHTFPEYGLYHVCQTVSNDWHTDSTCQWVELLPVTSVTDPAYSPYTASPNPFDKTLRIGYGQPGFTTGEITLLDVHGRVVYHAPPGPVPITLQLPDLASGMYVCQIRDGEGQVVTLKVVRQ